MAKLVATSPKAVAGARFTITPGGRGDELVEAGGREIWSRKKRGDAFPTEARKVGSAEQSVVRGGSVGSGR